MTNMKVKSFSDGTEEGGISFSPYFQSALRFYRRTTEAEKALTEKKKELQKEDSGKSSSESASYVSAFVRKELSQLDDFSKATQIFACMAVEFFLNFYGVACIGEEFYKRNLEKLSASQKLENLIALSKHEVLENGGEISKIVRRMFDRRNQLVHPKAKQDIGANGHLILVVGSEEPVTDAKKMMDDMVLFFKLIRELDTETGAIIEVLTREDY